MAYKVGMVSLGCAKNQVDGEVLMASLKNAGFEPDVYKRQGYSWNTLAPSWANIPQEGLGTGTPKPM